VEWLEPARTYIREKKYRYLSPAIRFNAKDRVSAEPIGARLTSAALTNNPFLDGMQPLAATDRVGDAPHPQTMSGSATTMSNGGFCYSANEVLPKLRAAMRLSEVATAAEMFDKLCSLETLYAEVQDPTAVHQGVDLGMYLPALRDTMQMGLASTWEELFQVIKNLIGAAMGQHQITEHSDDDDEEDAPSSREMNDMTTQTQGGDETSIRLRDFETKVTTLTADNNRLTSENAALSLRLTDVSAKYDEKAKRVIELEKLMADRDAADEEHAISAAFTAYKDKLQLTDKHKAQMRLTYRSDRTLFNELYPAVAPDQAHLQRIVTASAGAGTS
jgi:hypothetical protein